MRLDGSFHGACMRRLGAFAAAWVLVASRAGAEPSDTDRSLAESLFDQGKQLMAQGEYPLACPKFEESQRLDPAGGTLLNLAVCLEKAGKVATAWTRFKEASSAAQRDGRPDRKATADEHVATLEPQLPWLTLVVQQPSEDQEVTLDGALVGRAAWGTPVAIDPGAHEVRAHAAGRDPWSASTTLAVAQKMSLTVPPLATSTTPPVAAAPRPTSSAVPPAADKTPRNDTRRTVGWVVGGSGVALLGIGTYFGINTINKSHQSDDLCPTHDTCTPRGVELNEQAQTSAWLANVGIGLGLAGIGVGAYLLLTEHDAETQSSRSAPHRLKLTAAPLHGGAAAALSGRW